MTNISIDAALPGDIVTIERDERRITAPMVRMPAGDYGRGTIALDLYGDPSEDRKPFTFFVAPGFWKAVSVVRPIRRVKATIELPTMDEVTEEIMAQGFCYRADAVIAAAAILDLLKRNEVKS